MMTAIKSNPFYRNHLIRDGIGKAIYDSMKEDASIHIFGEGAHVKVHYDHPDVERDFADRVHTLPISEDGNVNFAIGTSLLGIKPIYDVISADFLFRAMDSIVNNAAKLNFVKGIDEQPATIIIRAEFLLGGPTTGQRPEGMLAHIPGLNLIIPSTPRDAYGLMRSALNTHGVTVFFEDRNIRDDDNWRPEDLTLKGSIHFGTSDWRIKGVRGNVTILTYGLMRQVVEHALMRYNNITPDYVARFQFETGRDLFDDDGNVSERTLMACDVIDLRSLYPLDWGFIKKMLERTGKLLIVEPDITYGGIGAEIAATIAEEMPDVRVKRLGARRTTTPAAGSLHAQLLPTEEDVIAAIKAINA